jgi:hypothetical protein
MTDDDKAHGTTQGSMRLNTPWKTATIVLAVILGVVLICAAFVAEDLTGLVLSLL